MTTDLDLGGVAAAQQEEQQQLEGTNHAQVKFVGMAWQTLDVPDLKEEVTFRVEGVVVAHGEEVMADGSVRPIARVKVRSVIPIE